jgi:hypothetical protein
MKTIKYPMTMLAALLLSLAGCIKSDEVVNNRDLPLKGKPVKTSYTLSNTDVQLQVYGVWHAGNDYCTWGTIRDLTEFDSKNHWIIDRGDDYPSVNLVVLSFVHPLKLMDQTTDETTENGIPRGMTQEIVNYFKNKGIRVMLSIGGITYTDAWNQALASNPAQLGRNAADAALDLGVGIEIDYEENASPNLEGLQAFIDAYREINPYDPTGANPAARLTIDLAAGDRWLIALCRHATTYWLLTSQPVLDYANAMVPARQPSASDAIGNWVEHIEGKAQYAPPIPPLAPCKFTGGLYITNRRSIPECTDFYSSIQYLDRDFVRQIDSKTDYSNTSGMLGYMFWAAECPGTRILCTTGNNACTGGVGVGSSFFDIPVPMPPLRQE